MNNKQAFSTPTIRNILKTACVKKNVEGLELFLAPSSLAYGRIGVITSRKSGNAVQRNRIRRRLKALFYEQQYSKKCIDCLVIVRSQGINKSFSDLKHILAETISLYENCTR